MKCNGQLQYNSFTIVWFQIFSLKRNYSEVANFSRESKSNLLSIDGFSEKDISPLDRAIFDHDFLIQGILNRYKLEGFNVEITINSKKKEQSPIVKGMVNVEATLYFDATVSITYKLVVVTDKKDYKDKDENEVRLCSTTEPLNSDDLILLAGIPTGTEHWHSSEQEDGESPINLGVNEVTITNLRLDKDGQLIKGEGELATLSKKTSSKIFLEVFLRYKKALFGTNIDNEQTEIFPEVFSRYKKALFGSPKQPNINNEQEEKLVLDDSTYYTLIDIWEDISHTGDDNIDFSPTKINPPEIISHIEQCHRSELIGLLTLYPYEWPYRDARFFKRACGENIAIDSDDLVLVSQSACTVFGTYGRRGGSDSPTDWSSVLKNNRLDYGVSWPEYQYILEIALSKQYTINSTLDKLQKSAYTLKSIDKNVIKKNSELCIEIIRIILNMDAVKFSRFESHKLMYKATEQRLELQNDLELLVSSLSQLDNAMKNIDNINETERGQILTILLGFIAVVSGFEVAWQNLEVPVVEYFFNKDPSAPLVKHPMSEQPSAFLLSVIIIVIFIAIGFISYEFARFVITKVKNNVNKAKSALTRLFK